MVVQSDYSVSSLSLSLSLRDKEREREKREIELDKIQVSFIVLNIKSLVSQILFIVTRHNMTEKISLNCQLENVMQGYAKHA